MAYIIVDVASMTGVIKVAIGILRWTGLAPAAEQSSSRNDRLMTQLAEPPASLLMVGRVNR
jgi:hypothetical protein